MEIARLVKRAIIKSPFRPSHSIEMLLNLLKLGKWLKENQNATHLESRNDLYGYVHTLLGNSPILYLEFGVFKGESMKFWSGVNTHAQSRFYGFDTFTGLPDRWHVFGSSFDPGHFDADGRCPEISDQRVTFVKGLFQDTLDNFLEKYEAPSQLIVHCDADLHASTLYVLTRMHHYMIPGTVLIFDDFSVANHDFKAFLDYVSSYRRKYDVIATAEIAWEKIALRML